MDDRDRARQELDLANRQGQCAAGERTVEEKDMCGAKRVPTGDRNARWVDEPQVGRERRRIARGVLRCPRGHPAGDDVQYRVCGDSTLTYLRSLALRRGERTGRTGILITGGGARE